MPASLLGTTGNFGIPNDQSGLLITDHSFDFSSQEKQVLDKAGDVIGLSLYQEKVEVKLSGLVSKTSPFAGKISGTGGWLPCGRDGGESIHGFGLRWK